jgi:hypothetical protein
VTAEEESLDIHLPAPSIWPATVGLGITLALAGVVTGLGVLVFGLLVLALGIGGWIEDLRRDSGHA